MDISIQVLVSLGGVVAAVASAMAVDKTKISSLEKRFDETVSKLAEYTTAMTRQINSLQESQSKSVTEENVKIAVLENNMANHAKELAELKQDIKTIMDNVQEIKEAVLKVKKGEI